MEAPSPPPLKTQLSRALYDFNSKLNVRSGALVQVELSRVAFLVQSLCCARTGGARWRQNTPGGAAPVASLHNTHTHTSRAILNAHTTDMDARVLRGRHGGAIVAGAWVVTTKGDARAKCAAC